MGRKKHSKTWKKSFQVLWPENGRVSYGIQEITFDDGTRRTKNLDDERLVALSAALAGGQPRHQCDELAREILANIRGEYRKQFGKLVHNAENQRILANYWEKHYKHRDISAAYVMERELKRAVDTVGHLSLISASVEELQSALNTMWPGNQQRRMADRLNTLLKFAGRDIKLRKNRRVAPAVRHLSWEQFQLVLPLLPTEEFRVLARLGFGCGGRVGEIFGLSAENWSGKAILQILTQHHREAGLDQPTKTRRIRKSFVHKHGRAALTEWFLIPNEVRLELRKLDHGDIFTTACQKAFPNEPKKHLVFRDLRHCYAIHMLRCGISISLVAQSLGNSVKVCQDYYAGYSLTDETISAISEMMGDRDS